MDTIQKMMNMAKAGYENVKATHFTASLMVEKSHEFDFIEDICRTKNIVHVKFRPNTSYEDKLYWAGQMGL